MKSKKIKAFTLIELMVVIAIISILAMIVLVNVSLMRNKARDVVIKVNIASFFNLASDYYEQHSNYGGFCEDAATKALFDAIPAYEKKEKVCQHDSDDWLVCAQLNFPEDRSKAWCLDESGVVKEIDVNECQQGTKDCP